MHIVYRRSGMNIRKLEDGDGGEAHDLNTREDDETDALHLRLLTDVPKRRLYVI